MLQQLNHRIKEQKRSKKKLNTPCAKFTKKLYKVTKPLKYFAIILQMIVPFIAKP